MSGTISKEEFKQKLDSGEYILLDVRTQDEHDQMKIAESDVVDVTSPDFLDKLQILDKNKKYLIYCASGARSAQALRIFNQFGFLEVYDLDGGIVGWV